MPISIIFFLLLLALFTHKSRPSLSFKALSLSVLLLLLSTLSPTSNFFISTLEDAYPPFTQIDKPVNFIVVLGCGHTTVKNMPATTELKPCSLQRLVEAIRISKLHPEADLIMSGYRGSDPISNAEKMKQAAVILGVNPAKIMTENFPKDTEEEAELIAPRVSGKTVVLVTNADHMKRSINYFNSEGVYPIAAPTGFWYKPNGRPKSWAYYYPKGENLSQTSTAWYETVGLFVQWLKSLFE